MERLSKAIITLKPKGRKASDIETTLTEWFQSIPRNLFKSFTFDNGKEFSNWKVLSNKHDVSIYFADPGTPSQRGLNEHSNGLFRNDGLPKEMDFNKVEQLFVSAVADKRNQIPRKSLNYQTPLEVFSSYINDSHLSSLLGGFSVGWSDIRLRGMRRGPIHIKKGLVHNHEANPFYIYLFIISILCSKSLRNALRLLNTQVNIVISIMNLRNPMPQEIHIWH